MTPAGEEEILHAAVHYYLAYEEELPVRAYTQSDIEYIIEQCINRIRYPEKDFLRSDIVH